MKTSGVSTLDEWWGAHAPTPGSPARAWLGLTTALLCCVTAVLGAWAWGAAGAGIALAVALAGVAGLLARQRGSVLASAGARPLRSGEAPRLVNLARGLAADAGVPVPELMIASSPDPNALVWDGRRPVVALSRAMVASFSLTELEAVLAHCLLRLRSQSTMALPATVLLSRVGLGPRGVVTIRDDVHAAALTRYPPALASAIAKCTPVRTRSACAYFVGEGPSHPSVSERLSALGDL